MPGRAIVAEEHWYVYHAGWEKKPWYWWFTDSRQVKRFKETRILGSSHVGLVYLYVNLPAYRTLESRASLVEHFRKAHAGDLQPASDTERKERQERLANLLEGLKGSLPDQDERQALESVKRAQNDRQAVSDPDVELIVQLEAQQVHQGVWCRRPHHRERVSPGRQGHGRGTDRTVTDAGDDRYVRVVQHVVL